MYHIIINPSSRSGRGMKLWKEIVEPALKEANIGYRSYFSEKAGDVAKLAEDITRAVASGSTQDRITLILLGGDGTVNEALQGLADPSKVTLGYIPTGSINDLARDLGISRDPKEALLHILQARNCHTMDMGILRLPDGTQHRFAVSCGIGFDAAVCEKAMQSSVKRFFNRLGLGKLTYLGIALRQLFAARRASCELTLDDKKTIRIGSVLFIASMIHRYEGGGFRFCPDAKDNDGILNLCAVGNIPKLLILLALPTAFFGKHYLFRGVNAYSAKRIRIAVSVPLCVHTDGEIIGHCSEITVECSENALRIIR